MYRSVLIVDDEKNTREGLARFFESKEFDVISAENGEDGWLAYQEEKPDIVLSDIRMPQMDGFTLLKKILTRNPSAAVILLTAYGSVEDAVKAMKSGAFHYLTKPVNLEELDFLIKKALSTQTLKEENKDLRNALFREKFEEGKILYRSDAMKSVMATVDKIAKSDSTVLIEGESGTGKELIAHRIHAQSNRQNHPFVAVHCAALTDTLLTSELFGHEKGAFTGAYERKIGRFEKAHDGTLFLDEIAEISHETQVKLLRVLQDGEFERVGGIKTLKANVRIVCATNKILSEEVKRENFREDLFYRINVIYLKIPPLRDRKADIPLLVKTFILHYAALNRKDIPGIEDPAVKSLQAYRWPGNIRELKNIIERMVVLHTEGPLTLKNLPEDIRQGTLPSKMLGASNNQSIHQLEADLIQNTMNQVKGNKSLAAKKLGISRRTLYRKLDRLNP